MEIKLNKLNSLYIFFSGSKHNFYLKRKRNQFAFRYSFSCSECSEFYLKWSVLFICALEFILIKNSFNLLMLLKEIVAFFFFLFCRLFMH